MISDIATSHQVKSPGCKLEVVFPAAQEVTYALGCESVAPCQKCEYTSIIDIDFIMLYLQRLWPRPAVDLNVRVSSFMLDTSLSYLDTILLFMLLDCNTVSERGLKKSAKKLAPLYEQREPCKSMKILIN